MDALTIAKAEAYWEDPESRIERLIDQQEPRIAQIFRTAVQNLKNEVDLGALADLIEQGRLQEAIDQLADAAEQLAAATNVAFVTSGQSTSDWLREAGVGRIVFDQVNLLAVAAMQRNRLELIREFTDEQRRATWMAVLSGVETGKTPFDVLEKVERLPLFRLERVGVGEHRIALGMAEREGAQIGQLLGPHHIVRFQQGVPRHEIQLVDLSRIDQGLVVVAQNTETLSLADTVDAGHGIGTVAHDVAQNHEAIYSLAVDGDKNRLKGFEIAVNVG